MLGAGARAAHAESKQYVMGRPWFGHELAMGWSWAGHGSVIMGVSWLGHGSVMGWSRAKHGQGMGWSWVVPGLVMACPSLESPWICQRSYPGARAARPHGLPGRRKCRRPPAPGVRRLPLLLLLAYQALSSQGPHTSSPLPSTPQDSQDSWPAARQACQLLHSRAQARTPCSSRPRGRVDDHARVEAAQHVLHKGTHDVDGRRSTTSYTDSHRNDRVASA